MKPENRRIILGMQSGYYLLTGLWPLLHMSSFMEITENTTDPLLVKTIGILLVCAAITFLISLYNNENSAAVVFLSVSSAIGLLSIDIYYNLTDEISTLYLIDAALQLILLEAWIIFFGRSYFGKLNNQKENELIDRM
jgi:hypothetical protein